MRSTLWPILAAFCILHAIYNWAIPLGEGPDEPGHLAYTLFLTAEGRLPVQRAAPEPSDVPGEGHQPPLAYALAIPAVAWLPPEQRAILLTANPRFIWAGGEEPGAFMRGSRELWPWEGLTLAWHMVRGVAGLCGAATVACTYLAARRVAPAATLLAPLAALLVALNPQLLFTTALATNDALLTALSSALLWWCVRPSGSPWFWAAVAGLLFGLALLTKQSALLLGPLILWGAWLAARGNWRRWVGITLAWGMVALLSAGWWYLRNLQLYGDPFGLGWFKAEFTTQTFAWNEPAAWIGAFGQLFSSFWARFGWMSLPAPGWTIWLYTCLCTLAVFGWVRILLSSKTKIRSGLKTASCIALVITLGLACAWTLAFAYTAGLVAWQGRMLFPALGSVGVLLAIGCLGLVMNPFEHVSPAPPARLVAAGLSITLLTLALYMPFGVIRPAYTWVALAKREALTGLGNSAYARYAATWEQGVVLRGWHPDTHARPGDMLTLALTWNSLEPVPRPWTVFVHLVDGTETIVAQSNSQPHNGALPFPLWTPGDWMRDIHRLDLPSDLQPGAYELRVGLYRPEKGGERQRVWAEAGEALGDLAVVGIITIQK